MLTNKNLQIFLCCCGFTAPLLAEEAQILDVRLEQKGGQWNVRAMVHHPDTGWDHYVDQWRITTEDGDVIASNIVAEPHTDEQHYAVVRDVAIPRRLNTFIVEAHDSKNGWSKSRVKVDLTRRDGPRYRVLR